MTGTLGWTSHSPAPGNSRGRTRTCDPLINSQLLYQLSYTGSRRGLDNKLRSPLLSLQGYPPEPWLSTLSEGTNWLSEPSLLGVNPRGKVERSTEDSADGWCDVVSLAPQGVEPRGDVIGCDVREDRCEGWTRMGVGMHEPVESHHEVSGAVASVEDGEVGRPPCQRRGADFEGALVEAIDQGRERCTAPRGGRQCLGFGCGRQDSQVCEYHSDARRPGDFCRSEGHSCQAGCLDCHIEPLGSTEQRSIDRTKVGIAALVQQV